MFAIDEVYKNVTITSKGSLEMRLFPRNKQLKHNAAFRDLDEEDVLKTDPSDIISIYSGSKILAEKAAWDFVQAHPSIDLATSAFPTRAFLHIQTCL